MSSRLGKRIGSLGGKQSGVWSSQLCLQLPARSAGKTLLAPRGVGAGEEGGTIRYECFGNVKCVGHLRSDHFRNKRDTIKELVEDK